MSLLYVNLLPQNRNVLSHLLTPLRLFFILIVPLSGELLGCSFGSLRINPSPPPTSLSKPIRRISCRECQGVYFQAVPSSGYIYQEYSSKVRTEEQVKSCIGGERSRAQSEGAERPGRDDPGAGSWEGDHSGCRWGGNPPPLSKHIGPDLQLIFTSKDINGALLIQTISGSGSLKEAVLC